MNRKRCTYLLCKLSIALQRLPPSDTCLQLKVSNVKLICTVKRRKINGICWICFRAKCWVSPNRNAWRNLLWLTSWPRLDMFSSSRRLISLFPAKLCFHLLTIKRLLLNKPASCWWCFLSEHFSALADRTTSDTWQQSRTVQRGSISF